MDPWLVIALITWPVLVYWFADSLLASFWPKYAAKREVRRQARNDRRRKAYLRRKERQDARALKWAQAHPDDPDAKEFLALQPVAGSASSPEDIDYLAEIRRRQQADDESKQRRAADKAAKELLAQQMLDWAIDNPSTPEARRHLEEKLDEATERLVCAERTISNCETMMQLVRDETDPERINEVTRRSEAEATKVAELALIRRIQTALQVQLPTPSEQ